MQRTALRPSRLGRPRASDCREELRHDRAPPGSRATARGRSLHDRARMRLERGCRRNASPQTSRCPSHRSASPSMLRGSTNTDPGRRRSGCRSACDSATSSSHGPVFARRERSIGGACSDRARRPGWCLGRHRAPARRRGRQGGSGGWSRCGRRRGARRRGGGAPRRKQTERVDVRLVRAGTDPEMDVGHVVLGVSRRPGLGERVPLGNDVARTHLQRPEVRERCLVAVGRRDRHGEPVGRDAARERNLAARGSSHHGSPAHRDVDAAVLTSRVRVLAESERTKDGAVHGPGPRETGAGRDQCRDRDDSEGEKCSRCP